MVSSSVDRVVSDAVEVSTDVSVVVVVVPVAVLALTVTVVACMPRQLQYMLREGAGRRSRFGSVRSRQSVARLMQLPGYSWHVGSTSRFLTGAATSVVVVVDEVSVAVSVEVVASVVILGPSIQLLALAMTERETVTYTTSVDVVTVVDVSVTVEVEPGVTVLRYEVKGSCAR